jgi:hypothetical protein
MCPPVNFRGAHASLADGLEELLVLTRSGQLLALPQQGALEQQSLA